MQIEKKEDFILITLTDNNFSELALESKKIEKDHLVVHISEDINISNEDFLLFLNIAKEKKQNGTSFVLIINNIDVEKFPEALNIVPTLQEAKDILEMEAIERELGF